MSDVAKERLYWNADRTKLVKEGDPAAASLAAAVGDDIPKVEGKSAAKAEDKMAEAPANKSGLTIKK